MSITTIGPFFYGSPVPDKPPLPDGFRYVESERYWLLALDGEKEYYVTATKLCRRKYLPKKEGDKGECWMVDMDDVIDLPCPPAS